MFETWLLLVLECTMLYNQVTETFSYLLVRLFSILQGSAEAHFKMYFDCFLFR